MYLLVKHSFFLNFYLLIYKSCIGLKFIKIPGAQVLVNAFLKSKTSFDKITIAPNL